MHNSWFCPFSQHYVDLSPSLKPVPCHSVFAWVFVKPFQMHDLTTTCEENIIIIPNLLMGETEAQKHLAASPRSQIKKAGAGVQILHSPEL